MSATLLLLGFEFRISLFFATRESIDCYIALFGKNYPNSLNLSGGDLFRILLRIGVSIGVSVRLTSFAHRAAERQPLFFAIFCHTHNSEIRHHHHHHCRHASQAKDAGFGVRMQDKRRASRLHRSHRRFLLACCSIGRPTSSFHLRRSGAPRSSTTVAWRHAG